MTHPVAFVSGASRGIGAGIARALFQDGYSLILTCQKNGDKLDAIKKELLSSSNTDQEILTFVGDMGSHEFVQDVSKAALEHFHTIDLVVNNAGISIVGLITDLSVEEWNRIVDVNLSSVFFTTKAFLPTMIHNKSGCIINISSMWGSVGASCEVAYSATKGAINSYTRALAKEVAPSGISVNAIACGVIDTDMNSCFSEEDMQALIEEIPVGRLGTPQDVGNAVLHLSKMDYVTGQILGLDGAYL